MEQKQILTGEIQDPSTIKLIDFYEKQIKNMDVNIKTTGTLLKYAKEYKQGKVSSEQVFTDFLSFRMNYLNTRTSRIIEGGLTSLSGEEANPIICTNPSEKKKLKSDPINLFAFQTAIDRYQLLSRALLCISADIDALKLSKLGQALLRASVSLHPLLKGEEEDPGHPDMAGGYGVATDKYQALAIQVLKNQTQGNKSLIENIFEVVQSNKLNNKEKQIAPVDVNYYKQHFLEATIKTDYPLHQWNREQKYHMTPFDADEVSPILPLPELSWLFRRTENLLLHKEDEVARSFLPTIKPPSKNAKTSRKKKPITSQKLQGEPPPQESALHIPERQGETPPKIALSKLEIIQKNEDASPEEIPSTLREKKTLESTSLLPSKKASPKTKSSKKEKVPSKKKALV